MDYEKLKETIDKLDFAIAVGLAAGGLVNLNVEDAMIFKNMLERELKVMRLAQGLEEADD